MADERQPQWSPDMKRLILDDLRAKAKPVLEGLSAIPPLDAPAWLQKQARLAIQPYVAAGGNAVDLAFWFGTVFGALVRATEVEEYEMDLEEIPKVSG